MKLTYIYHSGFALETGSCIVLIDYYQDPAGVVPSLLDSGKPVYVLASHFHPDHFNPEILEWKKRDGCCCTYLLSKDILRHRRARKEEGYWMVKGEVYADRNLSVRAFGSTDSGISFLIEAEGERIFHAGDLNNWHWSDESTPEEAAHAEAMYLGELKDIRKETKEVDVALFPVDARIGSDYMRGARQFVEQIQTRLFVPMHFTAHGAESTEGFRDVATQHHCRIWIPCDDGEPYETDGKGPLCSEAPLEKNL